MTTQQPPRTQPDPPPGPMSADGLHRVSRAARIKSAAGGRPQHRCLQWRQRPLIDSHQSYQNPLGRVHVSRSIRARRSNPTISFSTCAQAHPTMEDRATKTKSIGAISSCWCRRKTSRSSLLARFRTTADPIRRLAITPRRDTGCPGASFQFATKQPRASRMPSWRNTAKARDSRNRFARDRLSRGVPGTWLLLPDEPAKSDGSQPLSTLLPTIRQHLAPSLGGIPLPKTVLPFPFRYRRLIGSFHAVKFAAA